MGVWGTGRFGDEMRGFRIIFGIGGFRKWKGGIIGIYIVRILGTIIDLFLISRCYRQANEKMNTKEKFSIEIDKLKKQLSIKSAIRAFAVSLNAIGGIILGVYLRDIPLTDGDFSGNLKWYILLLFLFAVIIYLNFWIFFSDSSDKIEFLDRIKHKDELKIQKDLNKILIEGLNEVNNQTCETFLCEDPCKEKTFIDRLTKIATPLKNFIKEEYNSDVSIGVHLNGFRKLQTDQIVEENRIFKLHDELGINEEFPDNLLTGELKDKQGFQKFMFTNLTNIIFDENYILNNAVNNEEYLRPKAITNNFAAIFSLVPNLCVKKNPNCNGGLYIITNNEHHTENDLLTFYQLYGWFIGSYIDQYNQCIDGKVGQSQAITQDDAGTTPPS